MKIFNTSKEGMQILLKLSSDSGVIISIEIIKKFSMKNVVTAFRNMYSFSEQGTESGSENEEKFQ